MKATGGFYAPIRRFLRNHSLMEESVLNRFTVLLGAALLLCITGTLSAQESIPYVEWVGRPLMLRYGTNFFARNIWDMEVFDGRLYLGGGNSDNDTVGGNAGPVEAYYYDPVGDQFVQDYVIDEEQLDRFVVAGERMLVPGHDPHNNFAPSGRIYVRELGGEWHVWDTLPPVPHVYDVHYFDGAYYAALGLDSTGTGGLIARSTDDGATWQIHYLPAALIGDRTAYVSRAWSLFDFNGTLYVSTTSIPQPSTSFDFNKAPVFALSSILSTGHALFVQSNVDFFPAEVSEMQLRRPNGELYTMRPQPFLMRIERAVHFQDHLVYLAVINTSDHNWTPVTLYAMDTTNTPRAIEFETNEYAWDTWVEGDALYILLNQQVTEHLWSVRVMATCDLENWSEVAAFQSMTFARSFALFEGDFYFGLGTQSVPLSNISGTVLRVREENAVIPDCAAR